MHEYAYSKYAIKGGFYLYHMLFQMKDPNVFFSPGYLAQSLSTYKNKYELKIAIAIPWLLK